MAHHPHTIRPAQLDQFRLAVLTDHKIAQSTASLIAACISLQEISLVWQRLNKRVLIKELKRVYSHSQACGLELEAPKSWFEKILTFLHK